MTVSGGPVAEVLASGGLRVRLRKYLQVARTALASIATVGAICGGLVGYWIVWKTLRSDVLQEGQAIKRDATIQPPDVARRLSLVVLPFANLNNDPEQDYFADSITTDLTTDLAQMNGTFVIGSGTAFSYKNKPIDIKVIGKELGIRWAVQGAVRHDGDRVRVNVWLADISTGQAIWSDRFDGDRSNLLAIQDQITARLARSLDLELIRAESRLSEMDKSRNPDVMDLTMRGWAKFREPRSKMQNAQTKEIFENALRLDPSSVDAMIGKAECLIVDVVNGWSASVAQDKKTAADLADTALSKRPESAITHVIKGDVLRLGHPEDALREYDAALKIDPNLPIAYAGRAQTLILLGRSREAFSPLELALRISPKDPFSFLWHHFLCGAHLHLNEYAEAAEECTRSINLNSSHWPPHVLLVSNFGATGQLEQAQQALDALHKVRPDFTVKKYRDFSYALSSNPQFRREIDVIVDGLTKGGMSER